MQSNATTTSARLESPEAARALISLARYNAVEALKLTKELVHLEAIAGIPTDPALEWLVPALGRGRFLLFVASIEGRPVGFVAGSVMERRVEIARLAVAEDALAAHPELPSTLLSALMDDAHLPWAEVIVPHDFVGLAALLDLGWELTGSGDEDQLVQRLSPASLHRA